MKHALGPLAKGLISASVALAVAALGCSKKEAESEAPKSRVNEASVGKAKALVKAPAPLDEVKPKVVEVLGEPTATDGESLIWAGVDGDRCFELKLVVQKGEVKGTTSGSAHKMIGGPYEKCAALAGKK